MIRLLTILTIATLTMSYSQAGEFTKVGETGCGKGIYVQRTIVGYTHCRQPIYTSHVRQSCNDRAYRPTHYNSHYSNHSSYRTNHSYSRHSTYYGGHSSHHRPHVNVNYRSKHWNV